jgi:hypothetical protein
MFAWLFRNKGLAVSGARPARPGRARRTRTVLRVEALEARNLLDAGQLLIGTWNVDIADTGGANRNASNFQTVMAAMGQESAYGSPQAPDILTVTEVRSNANTGSNNDTEWLTQQMNAVYGAGRYAHDTRNGASTGGGTEGVIYNTGTVQLLQSTAVGVASTAGMPRQELRYLFRPLAAADGSSDFYVYVGHAKAGTTTTDASRRNSEAQQVRADADALGAGVAILYTGDFNSPSSNQAAEQTYLSAGNGQAFDPINRLGNWSSNAAFVDTDTLATTRLYTRSDRLWESGSVRSSTGGSALKDMPSTYHAFGNNGSVALNGSVTNSSNTALSELSNRPTVLTDLTLCSDHLPVLQRYQFGASNQPSDPGFETPSVGTGTYGAFQYQPSGSPWTFGVGAGVAGNGSGFTAGNPDAPQGTQVAFLQAYGSFSQAITFAAGTYAISFQAAQRGNGNASSQTFQVLVDGNAVGTFTPGSTSYATYVTASFTVSAGAHTITFVGLDPDGLDNTAFIDQVMINLASP